MRFEIKDGMIFDNETEEYLGIEDCIDLLNTFNDIEEGYERLREKMRKGELVQRT